MCACTALHFHLLALSAGVREASGSWCSTQMVCSFGWRVSGAGVWVLESHWNNNGLTAQTVRLLGEDLHSGKCRGRNGGRNVKRGGIGDNSSFCIKCMYIVERRPKDLKYQNLFVGLIQINYWLTSTGPAASLFAGSAPTPAWNSVQMHMICSLPKASDFCVDNLWFDCP